ncbi:MAG TPA: sugar-transfer associated ATP-grasp domain-containing protein, partial [Flavisolibacter sp.]
FLHYLFFPISYKDYGILCEDKLLTYASLAAFDVPQPNMLFCFDNHQFYDTHNNLIAANDVDALIQASTSKKLFIKPRFGSEGKDIFIFNKNNDNRFADKEQTIFNHSFFLNDTRIRATSGRDATGFYVIQEGLVQHEEVNQIYAGAINTFRVITECIQGEAQLLFALLRMGRGGNQVDNASSGGVYTKIDPVSGALGDVAIAHDRAAFEAHPDTGFQFKGATIKAWQNVKALALEAAIKFREIRHVGWDIALTPDGPVIIEINKRPDMDMIQDFYGGIQHHLKINSREWWYQSDYTIKNL